MTTPRLNPTTTLRVALPSAMVAALAAGLGASSPASAQSWETLWNDGRAELDGYSLVMPRYGELRRGTVVLIFVKEDLSNGARVKADPGRHPPEDVFPVMKLNVAKDFQTGIYDYNLMTSVFTQLVPHSGRRAGSPAKIVFSAQEWCGAMFEELLFEAKEVRQHRFSYFDGEGDESKTMARPEGSVTVDELPILVRGLPVDLLRPGESRELAILPSLERARLLHRPLDWSKGKLSRGSGTTKLETQAGGFEVETWTADLGNGDRYTYDVERAAPRRLIRWQGPDGEVATLTGSARLEYWKLNREGGESHLSALGLPPTRTTTP